MDVKQCYRAVPEAVYSWSCLPVITPRLCWARHSWVRECVDVDTFDPMQCSSGSFRLNLISMLMSRLLCPPVDHRYEWDISGEADEHMLDELN